MNKLLAILFTFVSLTCAQCPESANLKPCTCFDGRVTCVGPVGLIRLTSVLRRELCSREIEKFELLDSDVEYLASNLFRKVQVKEILISHTNISHFTRGGRSAFFGLEDYLNSLSMRRCSLVDELQWQMIGDLKALTYLDLSYNDLTRVPREWFLHPPPNLRSLILKKNKISNLEPGALAFMHKLVELDLSENRISSFERNSFPRPGNSLIFLRLSYNNLRSLPEDFFDEMLGLRRLYMDSNKMVTLPESVWRPLWGDMETLDLYGNRFLCECDMRWISILKPPSRLYGECHEGTGNLTGAELRYLDAEDFQFCKE